MRRSVAVGAFCGFVGLAGAVNADSINQADLTDGSATVSGLLADGSATATAYENYAAGTLGKFSHFSVFDLNPVAGVKSNVVFADPLINGDEAIAFNFAKAVVVNKLDVAFLYKGLVGFFDESAKFTVTYLGGGSDTFHLTPTSFTTADYGGPGTVTNESGFFGAWSVTNPFGAGRAVTSVVLQAGENSNFGFEDMTVSPATMSPAAAPLPAAVWGGMALMGAIGAARMRKQA